MKTTRPRLVWIVLALALIFGALWQFVPLSDASARLDSLPAASEGVRTQDVALDPSEAEIFSRARVVKRMASVDGQEVMMTAIDGTRDRHAIHDPRFCFQGAGWRILSQTPISLNKGDASLVKLEKDGKTTEAVYWFTDGARQFSSPTTYWTTTTLRRLTFGKSGSEPILVILAAPDGATMNWQQILKTWGPLQSL